MGVSVPPGASAITLCGVTIEGGLSVTGSTGPVTIGGTTCPTNPFSGSVLVNGNTGGSYAHNAVNGSVTVTNNSGGFTYGTGTRPPAR